MPSETHSHAVCGLLDLSRMHPQHRLRAFEPVGVVDGTGEIAERLLAPIASAFPLLEVRTDLELSGEFEGRRWTAASGHLCGVFRGTLHGIPATGRAAHLRFGRFQRHQDGLITESLLLLDLPALMMQAGAWPLAPPLGPLWMAPPPARREVNADAAESLALVEAMIAGLLRYDGKSLASMGMRDFWSDDFWWHGPAPVGTFQGHRNYEDGHQAPFLAAFPDRRGGNHRARFAEADLVASTGWPSIRATHTGGDWLGLAPTGRAVEMRVMDFWRTESGRLVENWVMIDIPHLLSQLGIDLFARMQAVLDRT